MKKIILLSALFCSAWAVANDKLSCQEHKIDHSVLKPGNLLAGHRSCIYSGTSLNDAYMAYRNHKKYGFTDKLHHTPARLQNYSKKFSGGRDFDAWEEKVKIRVYGKTRAEMTISGEETNWYEQKVYLRQANNQIKIDIKFYAP